MGAFWTGVQRASSYVSWEKAPHTVGEMRNTVRRAATGEAVLREAADSVELGDDTGGVGRYLSRAVDLRTAATGAVGFFADRRSSEIAQVVTSDVECATPMVRSAFVL